MEREVSEHISQIKEGSMMIGLTQALLWSWCGVDVEFMWSSYALR